MPHSLPSLPYDFGALEPHIDAKTMEIHHGKHHQAYVTKLNEALEKAPDLANKSLDELMQSLDKAPDAVKAAIRNNGGGHWNHSFFWQLMRPAPGGKPASGADFQAQQILMDAVNSSFGDLEKFKEQFAAAGVARFGSGWVWLVRDGDKLSITSTPNQDNPLMEGKRAILGLDVWEHAYYLKYQNKRPDYIAAWWNVVNWDAVTKNFGS
ncbi:MAG: superoxide dismutase [Gemmatimonadaceae bacterium]